MRQQSQDVQRNSKQKRRIKRKRVLSVWAAVAAILGVVLIQAYALFQVQHLSEARDEVAEAEARLTYLEHIAGSLRRKLSATESEQELLRDRAVEASLRTQQLRQIVGAVRASHRDLQQEVTRLKSELGDANQAAERDKADLASAEKEIGDLRAQLDEVVSVQQSLSSELQAARSNEKQLRAQLDNAQSELVDMRSRLTAVHGKSRKTDLPDSQAGARTPLSYDNEERDHLIRTIAFEASGETEIGKAAVAHVILNRKKLGRWGDRIQDVVKSPWQFEPWMTRENEIRNLALTDARYVTAAEIADGVLTGRIPDPTAGATHFLNPVVVQKRRGGLLPAWAEGGGQPIGRHVFYCPECDQLSRQRTASKPEITHPGYRSARESNG